MGVSKDTVKHNLDILIHISQADCPIGADNPEEKRNLQAQLQAQLFLTTLTWFESAGFQIDHLKQMCDLEETKKRLTENNMKMRDVWGKEDFAQSLVYQTLPVYVDVRFCSGGADVPLFQRSQESVAVTMQWLTMLTMHFQYSLDAPKQFYDYTIDRNNASNAALPSKIVSQIFHDIAGVLVNTYPKLELPASGQQNHHVILVSSTIFLWST
jgi:hypothetical protein